MFLEALAKTPFSKEFRFVSVDPGPSGQRPPLPAYLKAVPTLKIQGEDALRTGNDAMNWLSERKLMSGSGGMSAGGDDGPAAFGGELAGIGDEGWSYIGENMENAKGQAVRLTSTMVSLDNLHMTMAPDAAVKPTAAMMAAAGPAANAAAGSTRQTAKAKAFEDQLAAYSAAREMDLAPRPPGGSGPAGFARGR